MLPPADGGKCHREFAGTDTAGSGRAGREVRSGCTGQEEDTRLSYKGVSLPGALSLR